MFTSTSGEEALPVSSSLFARSRSVDVCMCVFCSLRCCRISSTAQFMCLRLHARTRAQSLRASGRASPLIGLQLIKRDMELLPGASVCKRRTGGQASKRSRRAYSLARSLDPVASQLFSRRDLGAHRSSSSSGGSLASLTFSAALSLSVA